MALDLNNPSPDEGEALPDLNEQIHDVQQDNRLPDLNEQIHDAQQDDLGGAGIPAGQNPRINPDDDIATRQEGISAHGNANFHGHAVLFDLNLHPYHQPDLEHLHDDYIPTMEQMHEYGIYSNEVHIVFDQEELSDSSDEDYETPNENFRARSKDLTTAQKQQIYEALLEKSNRGKLNRTTTKEVAELFNVNRHSVWRIWRQAKQFRANGLPVDLSSRKAKNSGRKRVQIDPSQVETIPLHRRCSIRKLARALEMPQTTVFRMFKDGFLRRHSSSLKPYLREENKKERLRWCLSMLDEHTLQTQPMFKDMKNIIHQDEKWFNATRNSVTYYMTNNEEDPHRTVRNKNYIEKVMFLCAVGNPQFDEEGNCTFDGKFGIWPFIREDQLRRRSGDRPRGTPVHKTMKVDRMTMRSYMIVYLLPAIKARWPRDRRHETIWIQQDNAKTHIPPDDPEFNLAVANTGLDIRLMNQPPNSPDMNVLDLGFFASLQSLTYTTISNNMQDLIANVKNEYENYDPRSLRNVFLTLQSCMIEVMKAGGGNKYKIPHMNKERLHRLGILPERLNCDRELYQSVMESLDA